MTDRKQSAVARRLIQDSYNKTTESIGSLSSSVTVIQSTVNNHELTLNPPNPVNYNSNACGESLNINLTGINYILINGQTLAVPNLNMGYPAPTASPGTPGYWITYTFTCFDIIDDPWSVGDTIRFQTDDCVFNGKILTLNKTTGVFGIRIDYPLSNKCTGTRTNWTITNPNLVKEVRVLCCATDLDGGWCPNNTGVDLSNQVENVIDGFESNLLSGLPVISGGYA